MRPHQADALYPAHREPPTPFSGLLGAVYPPRPIAFSHRPKAL